jgi:PAS domain S-box-containing protein
MEIVFFIYGLSFFVLGLAILVYPKKGSSFRLGAHLHLIAGFGLVHGINEWLDMFILIQKLKPTLFLESVRMVTLPVSFVFLVQFGVTGMIESRNRHPLLRALPLALAVIWGVIVAASEERFLMGDIWARYLLCVPGTVLTAYALRVHLPQFERTRLRGAIGNLKSGALVFCLYGILAGLFVPRAAFLPASFLNYDMVLSTLGVPIQIFRAVCAAVLAYNILRVLSVFHWETQNALRESELRFRTIATVAPIILFIENRDREITFAEGRGLDSLGIQADDIKGKPISLLFPDAPEVKEGCSLALAGKESVSIFKSKGKTFETCYVPLRDEEGRITGLIGVALDVTQRAEAQAELEKYQEEMTRTERMAMLGMMGSSMAEELDEPLGVTRLLLERLLTDVNKYAAPEEIGDTLRKSFSQVTKALAILESFSDAAQLTRRTKEERIDIYQMVKRIVAVFADRAKRVNLQLVAKEVDVVARMSISRRELEQIFFILIQNAISAADPGKTQKLVMRCRVEEKQMLLTFADTCGGIPAERLKTIFEPFSSARSGGNGTGLGLAIVERIVSSYGGTVDIESEVGKGTTFHVTLPVGSG